MMISQKKKANTKWHSTNSSYNALNTEAKSN